MTRIALALIALAACKHGGGDDYPITPGGDDVVSTPHDAPVVTDGVIDDAVDGASGSFRVCELQDLRAPATCQPSGVGTLTVTLGSQTATTTDTGAFAITPPMTTNLVWRASGNFHTPTVMPYTNNMLVPIIPQTLESDLDNENSVIPLQGEGSAVIYVVRAGQPLPMVTGSAGLGIGRAFADTSIRLRWAEGDPTGAAGVLWFANVPVGTQTFTLLEEGGTPMSIMLPVEEGAFTYATVEL